MKIYLIAPLLLNDQLESDFEVFCIKMYSTEQWSTLSHSLSNTPTIELSSFQFNDQDILKIIRALLANKAHGCDNILICIVIIYDQSIVKPLPII